eukprot:COSAG01_NODE_6506_length_3628_cov_17.003117_4_plen_76_part_00
MHRRSRWPMCSAGRAKVWKRSARLQRHSVRCVRACVHHVTDHEAAGGGGGGGGALRRWCAAPRSGQPRAMDGCLR